MRTIRGLMICSLLLIGGGCANPARNMRSKPNPPRTASSMLDNATGSDVTVPERKS